MKVNRFSIDRLNKLCINLKMCKWVQINWNLKFEYKKHRVKLGRCKKKHWWNVIFIHFSDVEYGLHDNTIYRKCSLFCKTFPFIFFLKRDFHFKTDDQEFTYPVCRLRGTNADVLQTSLLSLSAYLEILWFVEWKFNNTWIVYNKNK